MRILFRPRQVLRKQPFPTTKAAISAKKLSPVLNLLEKQTAVFLASPYPKLWNQIHLSTQMLVV